jgi:hypothetical protein
MFEGDFCSSQMMLDQIFSKMDFVQALYHICSSKMDID